MTVLIKLHESLDFSPFEKGGPGGDFRRSVVTVSATNPPYPPFSKGGNKNSVLTVKAEGF
jgi:hypothetical protein